MEKNVNGVMMKVMEMKGSNEAKFLGGRQKTSGIGSELKIAGRSVCLSFKACGSISFPS